MKKKLFTFNQLNNPDNIRSILVWFINFGGGHPRRYNVPDFTGTFILPCEEDFFVKSIRDGGGYVEVLHKDGTRTMINPICPHCGYTDLRHECTKNFGFKHYCDRCEMEV